MSREGALCRARAQACYVDGLFGEVATLELMGYRLIVLIADGPGKAAPRPEGAPGPARTGHDAERGAAD